MEGVSQEMVEQAVAPNVYTYNALMDAYSKRGDLRCPLCPQGLGRTKPIGPPVGRGRRAGARRVQC